MDKLINWRHKKEKQRGFWRLLTVTAKSR